MRYNIHSHFHPCYELLLSFLIFKRPTNIKYLHIGLEWIDTIKKAQPFQDIKKQVEDLTDLSFFDLAYLLALERSEDESLEEFLTWISTLSTNELISRFAPNVRSLKQIPKDLEKSRNEFVEIMRQWELTIDSSLMKKVYEEIKKAHLQNRKDLKSTQHFEEIIDQKTNGLLIEWEDINDVYLLPSWHFRPLTTFSVIGTKMFISYPLKNDPMYKINNIGKALADKHRLSILSILSKGTYSFTDLVKKSNISKGNLHYHLIVLRSIGFVHTHIIDESCTQYYSLRTQPLKDLENIFLDYINR